MGSKRVIAKELVDFMVQANPNAKYFYDLFGGGAAMSFEVLKRNRFEKVFYNELNTGVTELLKKIQKDGVTDEFYRWISREEFHTRRNEPTWQGGLLQTCWSFGSKQKDYLYGKHIEEPKRLLHEIIVNRCSIAKSRFESLTGLWIDDYYLQDESINKRRLAVMVMVKASLGRVSLEHLQSIQTARTHTEHTEPTNLKHELHRCYNNHPDR
jgi:hypothetical protein